MTDERIDSLEEPKPQQQPDLGNVRYTYTFSPVILKEAVGSAFLGIISIILMIALLRALVRNRELEAQLSRQTPAP
jgi:hypothetical protein